MSDNQQINHLISGASGFISKALIPTLFAKYKGTDYRVRKLVRSHDETDSDSYFWNPKTSEIDPRSLEHANAIIHLAGANIASQRWTKEFKEELRASRLRGTETLVHQIQRMRQPPEVFLCASAIGFYGDRGDVELTEQSSSGEGFLAESAAEWEAIALSASSANTRVAVLRFGVILTSARSGYSPQGGAMKKLLPIFKFGLGGPLGSGKQYMSWISLEDAVRAICWTLGDADLSGPINITSPQPVTNRYFSAALGKALHRPAIFPVPAPLLRLVVGEMADAALLSSCRAIPRKLLGRGFTFKHASLESALDCNTSADIVHYKNTLQNS